jgi:hypothetical protein
MATYYGPGTLSINHPAAGDMRQNTSLNCMEIYNGTCWTPIAPGWEYQETLSESVAHAVDTVAIYVAEDHADNTTIQDAYAEWLAATERFRVVLAMAENQ